MPVIAYALVDLINRSFSEGKFPTCLKDANVYPLFKSGNKTNVDNYRSISILPVLSKVFEKVVYERLYDFLEKNNLIYSKQFGFRSNRSTIDALAEITEKRRNHAFNYTCILLDLRKSFDTVNHERSIEKLEKYGVRGVALDWFKSYLTMRRQCVEIDGIRSDFRFILCGVPQGSILGPLLFILYINDLPNIFTILDTYLFADDTNCLHAHNKGEPFNLNVELTKIPQWMKANGLSLNIKKTQLLSFAKSPHIVELDGEIIENSSFVKYLGLSLDKNFTFKYHIDEIVRKLGRHVFIISKLRHFVQTAILLKYYNVYVKSIIQYGILIYGCTSYNQLKPIYLVQKKIIRLMYFRNKRTPSENLFESANILDVYKLYLHEVLKFAVKSVSQKHPSNYLNGLFERKTVSSLMTRSVNRGELDLLSPKNSNNKNSLKYRGTILLNYLISKQIDITIPSCGIEKNYNVVLRLLSKIIKQENLTDLIFT